MYGEVCLQEATEFLSFSEEKLVYNEFISDQVAEQGRPV